MPILRSETNCNQMPDFARGWSSQSGAYSGKIQKALGTSANHAVMLQWSRAVHVQSPLKEHAARVDLKAIPVKGAIEIVGLV